MGVFIRIDLPQGRYDAATSDPRVPEWPPHPARLHCALLAGARHTEELLALEWLEQQGAPDVLVDLELLGETRSASYQVTNRIVQKGGHQTYPAREPQQRLRVSALPRTPSVAFRWPAASPDRTALQALQALAKRTPYFGRSTSPVLVSTEEVGSGPVRDLADPSWLTLRPVPAADLAYAEFFLRVPYDGYTAALMALYDDGARAWEADRLRGYRREPPPVSERALRNQPVASPHDRILVLELPVGAHVPGGHVGRLVNAVRTALLRIPGASLPDTVTGHGADGRTHVAFMPLMDVGHDHAQGHAMGVGIALPRGDAQAEQAVERAVATGLTVDLGIIKLPLHAQGRRRQSRRLTPGYWQRPSRRWASATPVVLDRFPKKGLDVEIANMCERLGYPRPSAVLTSPSPLHPGVPRISRGQLPRIEDAPRPVVHVQLDFDRPVAGPLLLGRQRYLGMGLCYPQAAGPAPGDIGDGADTVNGAAGADR